MDRAALEAIVRQAGGFVVWQQIHETDLTGRPRELLAFVRERQRILQGPVPTEVIAGEFALAPSTVRDHMRTLCLAGLAYHPVTPSGKVRRCSGWLAVPQYVMPRM